jgi:pimeloyl-ACP methyl ester carboxylesterase
MAEATPVTAIRHEQFRIRGLRVHAQICGDDDPITPLVNHRVIAMLMPRATLRVMKGGGHLVLLDSAEQVGPVITSFLQGDSTPTVRDM